MLRRIDNCKLGAQDRVEATKDKASTIRLTNEIKDDIEESPMPVSTVDKFPRLSIPGNIHYVYKQKGLLVKGKDKYKAVTVNPNFFSKLMLMEGMLYDNFPYSYHCALHYLGNSH